MATTDLAERIVAAWRRHNDIQLYLVDHVPRGGLTAVPSESRGRDVARQIAHAYRVRMGWVHYHRTGKRPKLERYDKGKPPTRAQLKKMMRESGREVERFLRGALAGEEKMRMFGRDPVRWMGYLISHECHHRGQILLALKQNGHKLPEKVAVQGLWGKWFSGK